MLITNINNTIEIDELPCNDKNYLVIPMIPYFENTNTRNPASLDIIIAYLKEHHPYNKVGEIKGTIVEITGKCPLS